MLRARLTYGLLLLLALELALWGCFLVAARPFGLPLPLAAAVAGVGNVALGRTGARITGRRRGAVWPGVVWLTVIIVLTGTRPERDVVVPATGRGWAFLLVGLVSAAVVAMTSGARATPLGQDGR